MMDLGRLRSFAEVAERGTVAAAAAARGYTAPAISQHLAKLEAEVGAALFDRTGGRLRLTDRGRALLPIALEMLDLEARARAAADDPGRTPHHVIAAFASAISTLLLPRLDRLRRRMTLEILEREDDDAMRDLGLGDVDVVVTQEYQGLRARRHPRLRFTPLVTDRLRLVVPPTMPPSITIDRLAEGPWLVNGPGTRCTRATLQLLEAADIRPRIVASVSDNTTLLALVEAGEGATITPDLVLRHTKHDVTVADQDLGAPRTIYAVTRAATTGSLGPLIDELAAPPSTSSWCGWA